ncbi:hypothetical protein C1896_15075 [Pseudomonadaceae bacterium SI-3]|nr:hypothetical protein C1896_15075 [Pseudomonadaceae bacterium SI-3]
MSIFKRNSLIAFGFLTALPFTALQAQTEHDGHHPEGAPPQQSVPKAGHPQTQQGGMVPSEEMGMDHEGMDHDKMMQMHKEHMGSGQMDHGSMGKSPQPPQGSDEKSPQHDH